MPDAPTEPVARWCSVCDGEIYAGQHYYEPQTRAVCCECLPEYARRYFRAALRVACPGRRSS